MAKRRRCLIDMDGVIADFHLNCAKAHGKEICNIKTDTWALEDALGFTQPWWIHCDREFWATLPKTHEADQIINLVEFYFDCDEICFVTSPPSAHGAPLHYDSEAYYGKKLWLADNYPAKGFGFGYTSDKHFYAAPNAYLLDDSNSNIEKFEAVGGHGIIVPRLWNKHYAIADNSLGYVKAKFADLLD